MITVHSLVKSGEEDLFVLTYTDPNHPDHAVNSIFQGSEQQVRDRMAEGELAQDAVDNWFAGA